MTRFFSCLPIIAAVFLGSAEPGHAQVQTGAANPPLPPPATLPQTGAPPPTGGDGVDVTNIAKIPYVALIKIAQSDAAQPKDADIYTLRISSKINVPVSRIELFLDRPAAPEKLVIDPNGYFLVPHNETLLQENPDLVSNQPKGSLNLEVKLSLPKPELPEIKDGKVTYQALFLPIQLLNDSMRKVDPTFGEPDQQQFAIEFTTGPGGGLKLQRQFGSRTLRPDEKGSVWVIFDKVLFEEEPSPVIQVAPANAPVSVRPISAAQASAIRAK